MREVKSTTTRWLYTRYISKHDRKPLERGILRDLSNNEANLKLRTREARFRSVSIHRGGRGEGNFVRFRFVPRGRPEFRANSDWNVRNERELSWNRSYRRVGSLYSNYGGGGADRSGHVRISPRNCFRARGPQPSCLVAEEDRLHRECYWCAPLLACGYRSGVDLEAITDQIRGFSFGWRPILKGYKDTKIRQVIFEIFQRNFFLEYCKSSETKFRLDLRIL